MKEQSLKDAPALIERVLPAQKLSAESYKEQMAGTGKTLTGLGAYWKGRKPLIVAKACVLGSLLPATDDPERDLEVFEMLMGMDDRSFVVRSKRRMKPEEIAKQIGPDEVWEYFTLSSNGTLPGSGPIDWSDPVYAKTKVSWRYQITQGERLQIEAKVLRDGPYRERVGRSRRPEETPNIDAHIWDEVNAHLGTEAQSISELVEQLGPDAVRTAPADGRHLLRVGSDRVRSSTARMQRAGLRPQPHRGNAHMGRVPRGGGLGGEPGRPEGRATKARR